LTRSRSDDALVCRVTALRDHQDGQRASAPQLSAQIQTGMVWKRRLHQQQVRLAILHLLHQSAAALSEPYSVAALRLQNKLRQRAVGLRLFGD